MKESRLAWVHVGDLHIAAEREANYEAFLDIVDMVNEHLAAAVDFCVLPGDNADDGSPEQYALIRRGLARLRCPAHILPGDHDFKPGDLTAFYRGLEADTLPRSMTLRGHRCLFLDVVSNGGGGPDFAMGTEQLAWLEHELKSAEAAGEMSVVFMHAYPADLKTDGAAVAHLLNQYAVKMVDMGHTHYNELANDGTTIFATTRSTGQIEEGAVGFSVASLFNGVVSWRFKPLASAWPLVMIVSPADHRLQTTARREDVRAVARTWSAHPIRVCRARLGDGKWLEMRPRNGLWELECELPEAQFNLTVEALDMSGSLGSDSIVVAGRDCVPIKRVADGSDVNAVAAWPERHLLGTRLGPNRNGRQW